MSDVPDKNAVPQNFPVQGMIRAIPMLSWLTDQQQQQIINGLIHALDDPKRAVRREAVACRNAWFLLTQHT